MKRDETTWPRPPWEVVEEPAGDIITLERIQLCLSQAFSEQGWHGMAQDMRVRIMHELDRTFAVQVSMYILGLPDKDPVTFITWATPADAVKWYALKRLHDLYVALGSHDAWDAWLGKAWPRRPQRHAARLLTWRWRAARAAVRFAVWCLRPAVERLRLLVVRHFGLVRWRIHKEKRYLTVCPHVRAGKDHNPQLCFQHFAATKGLDR